MSGSQAGETILSGELAEMSLPTLLHLLEIESHSGWLEVDAERRIDFHRGHVTGALAGSEEGVDALKEILVAGGVRFRVLRGTPREARPLARVSATVFEAYRILDEWRDVEGSVLRLVGDQSWRPTGREIDALLSALDGRRTLGELVARTGVSICAIVDEVLEAMRLGLVVEAVATERPVPEREPLGSATQAEPAAPIVEDRFSGLEFFDLLDQVRTLTKQGDYDLAEAACAAALRLRPGDRIASQNLRRVRQLKG